MKYLQELKAEHLTKTSCFYLHHCNLFNKNKLIELWNFNQNTIKFLLNELKYFRNLADTENVFPAKHYKKEDLTLSNLENGLEIFLHRWTVNKLFVTTETSSAPFPEPPYLLFSLRSASILAHLHRRRKSDSSCAERCPFPPHKALLTRTGRDGGVMPPPTAAGRVKRSGKDHLPWQGEALFASRMCRGTRTAMCYLCVCACGLPGLAQPIPPLTLGVVSRTSEKQEGRETAEDGAIIETGINHLER